MPGHRRLCPWCRVVAQTARFAPVDDGMPIRQHRDLRRRCPSCGRVARAWVFRRDRAAAPVMSAATFTRRPAPELGREVIRYALDCRHGTTIGDVIPGAAGVPSEGWILAFLVERHEREERCGCARRLLAGPAS